MESGEGFNWMKFVVQQVIQCVPIVIMTFDFIHLLQFVVITIQTYQATTKSSLIVLCSNELHCQRLILIL